MAKNNLGDITENSLVPTIIGVTGHRDITWDKDDLENDENYKLIKTVFKELDDEYPNTPLVVLSPLAKGADRLVAEVALNFKRKNGVSIPVICPLPMPIDDYKQDFVEDGSLDEFEALFPKVSKNSFTMPLAIGSTPENIKHEGAPRDAQYRAVGMYIARQSQILLALWDGVDKENPAGTSAIVKERHKGAQRSPGYSLDETDIGPIYHFPVTRTDGNVLIGSRREIFLGMNLLEDDKPGSAEVLAAKKKVFNKILDRIEKFNIDVKDLAPALIDVVTASGRGLIPGDDQKGLPNYAKRLLGHYSIVDTLAIHYRNKFIFTLQLLFGMVLGALVFFEIYAHFLPRWYGFLLIYILIVGSAWVLFKIAVRKLFQSKYLDYRALAEGLRVQLFWVLSGRNEEVLDYYLPKQKSELDWIKYAVHSHNMPYTREEFEEKNSIGTELNDDLIEKMDTFALPLWVNKQAEYYAKNASTKHTSKEKFHNWKTGFIVSGAAVAVLLFLLELACNCWGIGSPCYEKDGKMYTARHVGIVLIALAAAFAIAIEGYIEKEAISAQAKRYAWMKARFENASQDLTEALRVNDALRAKEVVFELGKAALEENGDWLIVRRERELDVPT